MSDLVGTITHALVDAVTHAPALEPKLLYIEAALDQQFGTYDWTKSFRAPQILVYEEILTSEMLIAIHLWLRRKCADISNIILVTTSHLGVAAWWSKYCSVMGYRSFSIREKFYTHSDHWRPIWIDTMAVLPSREWFIKSKKIERVFSYYGGTYATLDRQYLVLKLLELSAVGEIDYIGEFTTKDTVLAYSENINYYLDQTDIDQVDRSFDQHVSPAGKLVQQNAPASGLKNERIRYQGVQWQTDSKCFASVVRETVVDDVYSCVTEKTLRAFLHHMVVIPVTFQGVKELEHMGFWFPHDIFDYSYQTESRFAHRTKHLITSIKQLIANLSIGDMQQYYTDNIDKFHANAKLVHIYINDYTINKEQL
jgi:hypothetical protein